MALSEELGFQRVASFGIGIGSGAVENPRGASELELRASRVAYVEKQLSSPKTDSGGF